MVDPMLQRISCTTSEGIVGAMNALMPGLPPDVRRLLNKAKLTYLQLYGREGLYERVNNRTVGEVLAECTAADEPKPIASGEVDGLRYRLYEAPTVRRTGEDTANGN